MPLHTEHSTTTNLRPRPTRYTETLDNECCVRETDIPDSIAVRSRVGVHRKTQEIRLRGFGSGEGVETVQEDMVEILTEESVRMCYMLLGDATRSSIAWYTNKDVSS